MEYVLAGIAVLILVAIFVAYVAAGSGRRTDGSERDVRAADRDDVGPPGVGRDRTPLGDTEEHAEADAERSGGTGRAAFGAKSVPPDAEPPARAPEGRFQRDPVGGESEARPYRAADDPPQ